MGQKFLTSCPTCHAQLELDSDWAGLTVQCSVCQTPIVVTPVQAPAAYPPPMPGMPYQQPMENKSTAALVLGILGILLWPLGLIFAVIGLIIGTKKKYTLGIVLNAIALVLNIIVCIFIAAILYQEINASRERAINTTCTNNLKLIGLGMIMYASDNGDRLPAGKGKKSIDLLYNHGYMFDSTEHNCPSAERTPSYVYVGEGLIVGRDDPELPIAFELPGNHPEGRINILHLGAHVTTETVPAHCTSVKQVAEYLLDNISLGDYRGRDIILRNAEQY